MSEAQNPIAPMTWHETIEHIRQEPSMRQVVEEAYLGPELIDNVMRYQASAEFKAILQEVNAAERVLNILDIGSGNGISAIAFALAGHRVTALEPDPSETIGAGAISKIANELKLSNVKVEVCTAEKLSTGSRFDVVFARQAMHHADELDSFIANCARFLKTGGLFITVRDHVLSQRSDLDAFLAGHPLQKFYGGEAAYTLEEYQDAFKKAGLKISKSYGPLESVINYHPRKAEEVNDIAINILKRKGLGFLAKSDWLIGCVLQYVDHKNHTPGRLYSFKAIKL